MQHVAVNIPKLFDLKVQIIRKLRIGISIRRLVVNIITNVCVSAFESGQ